VIRCVLVPQLCQGKLVSMGAADIQQAALDFAKKSEALLSSGEMAPVRRLKAEREATLRQLEAEQKRLAQLTESAAGAREAAEAAEAHRASLTGRLSAQAEARAASNAEMAELEKKAAGAPAEEVAKLEELLAFNERMNGQRVEFKKECGRQMKEWQHELEQLRQDQSVNADEDMQKLVEVERMHEAEEGKAAQMRRLVGQKGRDIAALRRQVDDIPTSAELMQYERRFRELYAQVASTLEETKKYYNLFNTLEEKKGYLSKEVSLLNSIYDNYTKATAGNKDKIVDSIETLLKSVQQMLNKVEQRLSSATSSKDTVQQKYDKLVEKQRKYFQLVKDYQAECQRNEELAS
jgi:chromosome segregation ATPase